MSEVETEPRNLERKNHQNYPIQPNNENQKVFNKFLGPVTALDAIVFFIYILLPLQFF